MEGIDIQKYIKEFKKEFFNNPRPQKQKRKKKSSSRVQRKMNSENNIKLLMTRKHQYEKKEKELRSKPKMNKLSKILAKKRTANIPIYERYDIEIKRKEKNLRNLKKEMDERKREENLNLTFKPKINNNIGIKIKSFKERVEKNLENYQRDKMKKITQRKISLLMEESEHLTFKPKINKRSEKINYRQNDQNFYERSRKNKLKREEKILRMKKEIEQRKFPFRPDLSKSRKSLSKTRKSFKGFFSKNEKELENNNTNNYENNGFFKNDFLQNNNTDNLSRKSSKNNTNKFCKKSFKNKTNNFSKNSSKNFSIRNSKSSFKNYNQNSNNLSKNNSIQNSKNFDNIYPKNFENLEIKQVTSKNPYESIRYENFNYDSMDKKSYENFSKKYQEEFLLSEAENNNGEIIGDKFDRESTKKNKLEVKNEEFGSYKPSLYFTNK